MIGAMMSVAMSVPSQVTVSGALDGRQDLCLLQVGGEMNRAQFPLQDAYPLGRRSQRLCIN